MTAFPELQIQRDFNPEFQWHDTVAAVADRINSFHEDYPRYVPATARAINRRRSKPWSPPSWPPPRQLQQLHHSIFSADKPSQWRTVNVTVGGQLMESVLPKGRHWLANPTEYYILRQVKGGYRPPPPEQLPQLMTELYRHYRQLPVDPENLRQWYLDFETIHPFVDGNGRVGSSVVALLSWQCHLHPERLLWCPEA